jgi:cell division transport system permease protein
MLLTAFTEGFKNIIQAKRVSFTAILVIYVSVFLICLITSVWAFTSYSLRYLDNEMQIILFLKKNTDRVEVGQMLDKFKTLDNVKKVEYVDEVKGKIQTLQGGEFKEDFIKNTQNIKSDKVNFDRIVLYTQDSKKYNQTLKDVESSDYNQNNKFDKIVDRSKLVSQLKNLDNSVMFAGIGSIILFVVISTLVMANVFQIMIYNHRNEIEIQRLVGATNSYIRAPFVAQSIIYYLMVAGLIIATMIPILNFLLPEFNLLLKDDKLSSEIAKVIYSSYLGILIFSTILGIATTYISINRYLKK